MAINLFQDPRKYNQTEALVGLGVLALLWYGYQQGWFTKEKRNKITDEDTPALSTKELSFNPDGSVTKVAQGGQAEREYSDAALSNKVAALVEAYNGEIAMFSGQEAAFQALRELNELNDKDLIQAANIYNTRYENSDYKGLGAFVNSENLWWWTDASAVRSALLIRLNKLSVA